jgi:hypothetical protein
VEDEEEMFGPYGQGLADDSENSDSQGVVVQGTESPVETPSENMSMPEPAPSTSVESTARVSGSSNFDLQQLFHMLEENRQKDKRELEDRDKKNHQILEEKLEQNQQKLEETLKRSQQEQSQQIREEIKVQATEINRIREECHKKYDQLEKRFSSELAAEIRQVHTRISSTEEKTEKELRALKGQIEMDRRIQN